jgi:hypothetical protein
MIKGRKSSPHKIIQDLFTTYPSQTVVQVPSAKLSLKMPAQGLESNDK